MVYASVTGKQCEAIKLIERRPMRAKLSNTQIAEFKSNGAILVKNAVDSDWVERLNKVVTEQLQRPSKWANDANPDSPQNRMFTDRYLWQENDEVKAFVYESGCAEIAAQAMQSSTARFYFDHLLVKEPGTDAVTPWHQDVPYWPFLGKQICSMWVALTKANVAESSLEFIRGSHLANRYYMPEVFGTKGNPNVAWTKSAEGEPVPPIEANRSAYDIIGFDVEPGDAILFSAWILHWAPGNVSLTKRRAAMSTRWLGDDVIWHPHEGADPTVTQEYVSVLPGEPLGDEPVLPCIWSA
jgi:ectoine hydroxylase-related dioxygenase (phytanoyl-CoA dioxygenase family)